MKLQAHGIETDLAPGWEGRIALRKAPPTPVAPRDAPAPQGGPEATPFDAPGRVIPEGQPGSESQIDPGAQVDVEVGEIGAAGEMIFPVAHLGNFALPENRGDFGSGAVDLMRDENALVVLAEFGPECAGTALFSHKGVPTQLTPNMFSGSALQRTIPNQAGCQVFFTVENRAFCLYTVLGRQSAANRVLPQVNATLASTRISPR